MFYEFGMKGRFDKEVKYGKYLLSTLRERELYSQMVGNTISCSVHLLPTLSLVAFC